MSVLRDLDATAPAIIDLPHFRASAFFVIRMKLRKSSSYQAESLCDAAKDRDRRTRDDI
jgi:hypothetical protein